jgi:putative protease
VAVTVSLAHAKEPARDGTAAQMSIREQLSRLGNTPFEAERIDIDLSAAWFLPASALNALRREAVEALEQARRSAYRRPARWPEKIPPARYPAQCLTYLGNVANRSARAFYARHGVERIEEAYECERELGPVSLMTARHCLRHSFDLCPKQGGAERAEPLQLVRGGDAFTLRFDCARCEMHVEGRLRRYRN